MSKNQELPGMESPKITEIEKAAEYYVTVRDKRMAMTEKEIVAKTNLIQTVQEHEKELAKDAEGNRSYRFDDLIVILKPGKANVKVKHAHDEEDTDEE